MDAADYIIWRKTGGSQTGYQFWQENFGYGTSGGGSNTTVPEPATMVYLLATSLLLASKCRLRYKSTNPPQGFKPLAGG